MPVRRARRVVAAAVSAGLIGLAAVGCSEADAPVAAAGTVAPAEHVEVLAKLPAAVDGTRIVVGEAEAPHTVRVYVDPRCGYCAKFEASAAFEDSGVGGTPTVLVDGAALPGGGALYDATEFSKALRDAGV